MASRKDLLSQLECPVCFQTPKEGCFIFQCGNGHTICLTCHRLLEYSPVYQERILPKKNDGGGIRIPIAEEYRRHAHEGNKEPNNPCAAIAIDKDDLCKKDLLSQLQCPVCFQTPKEGCFIFQCGYGHTICATCHKLLEYTPVYQERMLPIKKDEHGITNLIEEEYIRLVQNDTKEGITPFDATAKAKDDISAESTSDQASCEQQLTDIREKNHCERIVNSKRKRNGGSPNKLKHTSRHQAETKVMRLDKASSPGSKSSIKVEMAPSECTRQKSGQIQEIRDPVGGVWKIKALKSGRFKVWSIKTLPLKRGKFLDKKRVHIHS